MKSCPCNSKIRYLDCCGLYLQKKAFPDSPEKLMRSRYTAFVEKNTEYLRKTMKPPALLKFNKKEILKGAEQWCGLEILNHHIDANDPTIGFVEFIAKYKLKNNEHELHEVSQFKFENGKWYYVDAIH